MSSSQKPKPKSKSKPKPKSSTILSQSSNAYQKLTVDAMNEITKRLSPKSAAMLMMINKATLQGMDTTRVNAEKQIYDSYVIALREIHALNQGTQTPDGIVSDAVKDAVKMLEQNTQYERLNTRYLSDLKSILGLVPRSNFYEQTFFKPIPSYKLGKLNDVQMVMRDLIKQVSTHFLKTKRHGIHENVQKILDNYKFWKDDAEFSRIFKEQVYQLFRDIEKRMDIYSITDDKSTYSAISIPGLLTEEFYPGLVKRMQHRTNSLLTSGIDTFVSCKDPTLCAMFLDALVKHVPNMTEDQVDDLMYIFFRESGIKRYTKVIVNEPSLASALHAKLSAMSDVIKPKLRKADVAKFDALLTSLNTPPQPSERTRRSPAKTRKTVKK